MAERHVLGVGIVGAGFIGHFHVRSWQRVRDADIVAVSSRTRASAVDLADEAMALGVGTEVAAYDDVRELARDERVDAIWVLAPNDTRIAIIDAICEEVTSGRAELVGIAVEKPLGRTVREAQQVLDAVTAAGLLHGYLENQVFSPAITRAHDQLWRTGVPATGTPYLARCGEEHSGPHKAWFWDGTQQGGGVLNDMMCHSVESGRFLLTPPGMNPSDWLTPVRVSAQMHTLKWGRDRFAEELMATYPGAPDYRRQPSEDYAHAVYEFRNGDGETVVVEATTSWSFVGTGMRLNFELLGPEYSMNSNTLNTESSVFFSRAISQDQTEAMVEKQNAEVGLMPVVSDEALSYGYTDENATFVTDFLNGRQPLESLANGVDVVHLLMAAYQSAEQRCAIDLPADVTDFIPAVAQGTWRP